MPLLPMSLHPREVAAPGPPVRAQSDAGDGVKDKGKGKGKDNICRSFKETGQCTSGGDCWFAKTTPNHP
eukprot:7914240-Pyramimonas_sp.AAC.1